MSLDHLSGRLQSLLSTLKTTPRDMPSQVLAEDDPRLELLSAWNQNSPRVYIAVVLCLPFDNADTDQAERHLKASLRGLARERPLFSSRLKVGNPSKKGLAHLDRSPDYTIPFTSSRPGEEFDVTYARAEEAGFPPGLFIKERFGISGGIDVNSKPLPVSMVHASFVEGGIFLTIFLHHSLCDGDSLRMFVECLAAHTRNEEIERPSEQTFTDTTCPTTPRADQPLFRKLLKKCPEYTVLPEHNGPTQPAWNDTYTPMDQIERVGKIFVFSRGRIEELQELIQCELGLENRPSKYTCLAALTFAHVSKARIEGEHHQPEQLKTEVPPPPQSPTEGTNGDTAFKDERRAQLWNSVSWRKRAFQGQSKEYFGNAALPAVTTASVDLLCEACGDVGKLAALVPLVKESIDAVDEEYVYRRLAMISASPDPRQIGVNYDPRMSNVLAFNTWRHFGADAEWAIPGVLPRGRATPDAIRRAHGSWGLGTALILPAKTGAASQELFVSIARESMDLLCADEEWLRWVDRVIG